MKELNYRVKLTEGKIKIRTTGIAFEALFIVLTLICCFNRENPDYTNYESTYIALGTGAALTTRFRVEPLFGLLCTVFSKIGVSYFHFKFAFQLITLILLRKFIVENAKKPATVILCFALYPFVSFCVQLRNAMSAVIILNSLKFLKDEAGKKGIVKYITAVVIATLIHDSSIIYLLFIVVRSKKFFEFYKKYIIIGALLIYTVLPNFIRAIYNYTSNRRFLVYNNDTPMSVVIRHTLPIITVVVVLYYCANLRKRSYKDTIDNEELLLRCSLLVCSFILLIKLDINFFRLIYFMLPLLMATITNYSQNSERRFIRNDKYLLSSYTVILSLFYFIMLDSPLQEETFNEVTTAILPWLKAIVR